MGERAALGRYLNARGDILRTGVRVSLGILGVGTAPMLCEKKPPDLRNDRGLQFTFCRPDWGTGGDGPAWLGLNMGSGEGFVSLTVVSRADKNRPRTSHEIGGMNESRLGNTANGSRVGSRRGPGFE